MKGKKVNRRRFLKSAGHLAVEASCAAAGVIGFPYIVSASALGKADDVGEVDEGLDCGFAGLSFFGGDR